MKTSTRSKLNIIYKMSILVKLWFIVATYTCYVNCQSCSSGTCIPLLQCPELLSIINKPNRTPQEVERLKSAQCGFEGNSPKVCCPAASDACYTPDGKEGKCISIYQCPHLANMLKVPYSRPDNVNYILNSKCTGSDRYSVCCGPPRNLAGNLNTKCTGILTAFPPDPETKCCGLDANVGNKITGGNVTTVDQYPWLTLIEYTKDGGPVKTLCGGALISGRYVLTAGHCVSGAILNFGTPKNIRLGEYDTSNPGQDCAPADGGGIDCNDGTVVIPIEENIPHPEYKKGKLNRNDIALIRMKQSAPFTDFIRPICMPTADITVNNQAGITLIAAGWGAVSETQPNSAVKLFVDLPFVARDVCQGAYRAPGRNTNLWEGQLCAGGVPGKDSCKGDSGGPLMYESSTVRRHEVIGVVSFGPTPCGLPDIPGVYTKVYEYRDWIKSVMRA